MNEMPAKKWSMVDEFINRADMGEDPNEIAQSLQSKSKPAAVPQDPIDKMTQEKLVNDAKIGEQIEAQEDVIVDSSNGVEKGLLGAANAFAQAGAQITGRNGSALKDGFDSASKQLDEPVKKGMANREFLKERLSRTGDPLKTESSRLGLQDATRNDKFEKETYVDKVASTKLDVGIKAATNTLKQNEVQFDNSQSDSDSVVSKSAKSGLIIMLRQKAKEFERTSPEASASLKSQAQAIQEGTLNSKQVKTLYDDFKMTAPADQTLEWYKAKTARLESEKKSASSVDKDLKELSKRVGPETAVDNAFAALEKKIGLLDKDETLNQDLDGVSVPGIGRVSFYNEKAREIDSAIQAITGPLSNARYGASQTNMELRKLAIELAEGKFNNEKEKLTALARLKTLNQEAIAEEKAGFTPETVELYESRRTTERGKVGSKPLDNGQKSGTVESGVTNWPSGKPLPPIE